MDAYLLRSEYLAPLEAVDAARPAHREWLTSLHADGLLVIAGRLIAKSGSLIVIVAESSEAAAALASQDPYVAAGLARYDVVPFEAARWGVAPPAVFDRR